MRAVLSLAVAILGTSTLVASEFVLVEPGAFPRGQDGALQGGISDRFPLTNFAQYYTDDERPFHHVFITEPFHIAKHEVTVGEFAEFVEATGYVTDAEKSGKGIVGWNPSPKDSKERHDFQQAPEFTWRNPGFPQEANHPVVGISWNDAQAYIEWRSKKDGVTYRLPTEAEWEYAAQGGQGSQIFPWGDEFRGVVHRKANISNVELEKERPLATQRQWLVDVENDPGDGYIFTAPVGSFDPNGYGLHDLAGNAMEWCQDYYKATWYEQWMPRKGPNPVAVDPLNDSVKDNEANEFRVLRGGSWYTGPLLARSSARMFFDAPEAAAYTGFRLVREPTAEENNRFEDPHARYEAAVKLLEADEAQFSPINRTPQLRLRRKNLTPEKMAAIEAIPGLERIFEITAESWTQEMVNAIGRLKRVEMLEFVGGPGLGACDLTPIGDLPRLSWLVFGRENGIHDGNLRQLAELTTLGHFRVYLGETDLSDEALRLLASNRSIKLLSIDQATVSGTFLEAFAGIYLRDLTVRPKKEGPGWTRAGSEALARAVPKLWSLDLMEQRFGDEALAPLVALDDLEKLNLSRCPQLTDAGIAALARELPRLERLSLDQTAAGKAVAAAVPAMLFLKDLQMPVAALDDAALFEIARSRSLRELHLAGRETVPPGLTDQGVALLGKVPFLEELSVECPVPMGPAIAGLAAAPTLKSVSFAADSFSQPLLEVLSSLKNLQRVSVYGDPDQFAALEPRLKELFPEARIGRR